MQTGDEIVRVAFKRIYVSFRWSRCSRGFSVAENWRMMAVEGNEWWKYRGCCLSSCLQFSILQFIDKDFCLKTYKDKRWICFFVRTKHSFFIREQVSFFFFFWKYWIYFRLLYRITSIILVFFKISRDYFSLFDKTTMSKWIL